MRTCVSDDGAGRGAGGTLDTFAAGSVARIPSALIDSEPVPGTWVSTLRLNWRFFKAGAGLFSFALDQFLNFTERKRKLQIPCRFRR